MCSILGQEFWMLLLSCCPFLAIAALGWRRIASAAMPLVSARGQLTLIGRVAICGEASAGSRQDSLVEHLLSTC